MKTTEQTVKPVGMVPTEHEKSEWARFARAAYSVGRNDVGHRFSTAASLNRGASMATAVFDALQADYRAWLVFGEYPYSATRRDMATDARLAAADRAAALDPANVAAAVLVAQGGMQ